MQRISRFQDVEKKNGGPTYYASFGKALKVGQRKIRQDGEEKSVNTQQAWSKVAPHIKSRTQVTTQSQKPVALRTRKSLKNGPPHHDLQIQSSVTAMSQLSHGIKRKIETTTRQIHTELASKMQRIHS